MLVVFTASVCVCVPASSCFCPLSIEDWMQLLMWRQQTKGTAIRIQNRDFTTSLITSKGILHWNSAPVGLEGGSVKFWARCCEEDWSWRQFESRASEWTEKSKNIYNVVYPLAGSKALVFDKRRDSKMNCLSSHFAYIVLLWYTSVILCLLSSVSLSAVFFMMSPEQKHPMFWSFSPLILFWQQQVSHLWSKLVANYVAYQSNGITRTRCTYEFVHYLQNSLRI